MKFNIAYMGPAGVFSMRRDYLLAIQYGLQSLGHDAIINRNVVDTTRFNILISTYWLKPNAVHQIIKSKLKYIHINTEIIANDMLNYKPDKCNFLGDYVPMMQNAVAAWDGLYENMSQYPKYGIEGKLFKYGYHEKLKEIEHREKDLDFYFFGSLTEYRVSILRSLRDAGLIGVVDEECSSFLRNDRIARSKVNISIGQGEKYNHVPALRICYLANNDCYIVSEKFSDPLGYLGSCDVVDSEELISHIYQHKEDWRKKGEENCDAFKKVKMKDCMQELLDLTF